MSAKVFVDSNILLYAHDSSAGPRHDQAKDLVRSLWQDRTGVLSTQILQEVYVNLRKKGARPLGHADARALIEDYLRWDVVVNTADSVIEATRIEERYQVSFWDALVIQAAQAAGVTTMYSEDLNAGQDYGGVRVVNPFEGSRR